ncbi:hypothetical protein PCORN_01390 [Listeria cornellensis FSL F6-0969]|uniref:Uncharacterized protein n=1 Tax=Listeria cornellensis FSL F6-0969 TaxID=1265820 RepID=W7C694_9LIST|nr:hypothetical protein PCORN_01390 [Listeria cornellensis FSL F6-0969]
MAAKTWKIVQICVYCIASLIFIYGIFSTGSWIYILFLLAMVFLLIKTLFINTNRSAHIKNQK